MVRGRGQDTACRAFIEPMRVAFHSSTDFILAWIRDATGAHSVKRGSAIQSLWGGYGELFRVRLSGADFESAVVKWVRPPPVARAPETELSHARKRRSYEVETEFYRSFAPRCDDACRVPRLISYRHL